MSNSHIQRVSVLTQYNSRSLNEHLNSSKWWDFGRKQGGLYIFTPTITAENGNWYRGTADALAQNIDFLKRSHEPYVIVAGGDCVYKLDYNKVLDYHIQKKADITIVCKDVPMTEDVSRFGVVQMNEESRIVDSRKNRWWLSPIQFPPVFMCCAEDSSLRCWRRVCRSTGLILLQIS